jgi:hypothetical protein
MPVTPNAWVQLATYTITSSGYSTITFNSIPGTYGALVLSMTNLNSVNGSELGIRFNGDSGTNYQHCRVIAEGTPGFTGDATTSKVYARIGDNNTTYSTNLAYIPNYANTSVYKTIQNEGLSNQATTTGSNRAANYTAVWKSNSAITSLSIVNESNAAHAVNSIFALYGLKG